MTHRIQKTIVYKYLSLVDKPSVNEAELSEFIEALRPIYEKRVLTNNDIYRQRIEFIASKVVSDLEAIRRKRTVKEMKLELSPDTYKLLKDDLEGVDYSKTELTELLEFPVEDPVELTRDNVITILEKFVVLKRRLNTEAELERFVLEQFAQIFGRERVARQYSVGGFLALKTDVDLGNGKVGIEIKLADSLNATDMQRVIGQVIYYKKRFYDSNLLVFLASRHSISSHIKELKNFIEELGVTVIYCQAVGG